MPLSGPVRHSKSLTGLGWGAGGVNRLERRTRPSGDQDYTTINESGLYPVIREGYSEVSTLRVVQGIETGNLSVTDVTTHRKERRCEAMHH